MQQKEVAAELKISRRKSGLTNKDIAHLLAIDPSRVSRFEGNKSQPTIYELCNLSLIYGTQIEQMFSRTIHMAATNLKHQLNSIPPEPVHWKAHGTRLETLNNLFERLSTLSNYSYDQ